MEASIEKVNKKISVGKKSSFIFCPQFSSKLQFKVLKFQTFPRRHNLKKGTNGPLFIQPATFSNPLATSIFIETPEYPFLHPSSPIKLHTSGLMQLTMKLMTVLRSQWNPRTNQSNKAAWTDLQATNTANGQSRVSDQ